MLAMPAEQVCKDVVLHNWFRLADIDIGTLIFVYVLRYKEAFNAKDYVPPACEFQQYIISMNLIYKSRLHTRI